MAEKPNLREKVLHESERAHFKYCGVVLLYENVSLRLSR